ncbi:MAG: hypothetical protein U5K71_08190 [Gracilimonas sp.]|nr:hypothetical protein [Gracilimonas sp.]
MRKKNEIEQELYKKELEADLHKDLKSQFYRIEVLEKFYEDKNPYLIGLMNFILTFFFFEILFFLIRYVVIGFTLGFAVKFFSVISPFVHIAILILCITSVIKKRSAVETVIDRWPF